MQENKPVIVDGQQLYLTRNNISARERSAFRDCSAYVYANNHVANILFDSDVFRRRKSQIVWGKTNQKSNAFTLNFKGELCVHVDVLHKIRVSLTS